METGISLRRNNTAFSMSHFEFVKDDICIPNKKKVDNFLTMPDTSSEATSGIRTYAILLLILFLLLVVGFYLLYVWIRKYKLKYLFRISFLVFILTFSALCISHLLNAYQEMPATSLFARKSFWSSASIATGSMCFLMIIIRYYWVMPINVIMEEIENFTHLEPIAKSRRQTVSEICGTMFRNFCRDPSQMKQPVYPNGWIPLIESTKVQRNKVVSVNAVGYRFCIYRGEEGKIFVTDAFCPHMGADLSAGGKVIGNCIECPFHAWQFSGETGKCTRIPYSDKIPDIAKIKVWNSCEKNGYVFVWHHAENEPPTYEIPSISEIENGEWVYRGRTEFRLHCHIQDIQENGTDIGHFPRVHSQFSCLEPQLEHTGADGQSLKHHWESVWFMEEDKPHIGNAKVSQKLMFRGFQVPYTRMNLHIRQIGPAINYIHLDSDLFKGIILFHTTSEGPLLQRIVHILYTEPKFKQSMANSFMWMEAVMFKRDVILWNNKIFVKNPILVKEEKVIAKFRRWYSQFYSEHSPSLKDLKERTLEW